MIKGFRRVLHVMPDELSEGAVFRDNISRLKGTGLTFDLVVKPHQLKKAAALADLNPDVQFILDHCGVPDIKGGGYDLWRAEMTEIAKRPNITGKLSGIVAYTDTETWTLDDISPMRNTRSELRFRPHGLGQRLAGLHAGRHALHLGRCDACAA